MAEKNNSKKMLIIGIIIGLLIGGVAGYFIDQTLNRQRISQRNNFQLTNQQKTDVTNFIDSTTDITAIQQYCNQNRMNCAYYCRTINPGNEACKEIVNQTFRGGKPAA